MAQDKSEGHERHYGSLPVSLPGSLTPEGSQQLYHKEVQCHGGLPQVSQLQFRYASPNKTNLQVTVALCFITMEDSKLVPPAKLLC